MILADTHVVLWLSLAPEKISKKATAAIEDARAGAEGLAIADITLFEVATMAGKRRIVLGAGLDSFLREIETRFVVLPINSQVCTRLATLPATFPKDPADRIIAATALAEGLALITADEHIRNSEVVRTIW